MKRIRHILAVTGLFSILLIGSAAEPASNNTKVSGHVVLSGKPLAKGRVFFHLEAGQFMGSKVVDGKYAVDLVPVGTHAVTVEGDGVPAKYTFDDKSGLVMKIKSGINIIDFDLQ